MNTSTPKQRLALASLSLSILLPSLATSIANVALPTLAQAFQASFQNVQWILLAYLLAITTLIVTVGRLGDLAGRRRLLLAGVLLFTVASVLSGTSSSLWFLVAARAAQGLGAAAMMALAMAFVAQTVPNHKIGRAMGLLGAMSAMGTALGPSLGGVLIANFGWRSIFFINLPLGLLTFLLTYRHLPADRPVSTIYPPRFDTFGTLLLALTLSTYALSMTIGRGILGLANLALLLAAAFGARLFVRVERRAAYPLLPLEVLRNATLTAAFAKSTLVSTVVMATLVVGPFYLAGTLALHPADVGLVMSSGPFVAALAGIPSGRIVDHFGTRRTSIVGLIAMAVGTSCLASLPTTLGVPGYIASLIVLTAGYSLFLAANNTAAMTNSGPLESGVISGILNFSRFLGLITGASVMGNVFALASSSTNTPQAVATGMRTTFAVGTVLLLAAVTIAAWEFKSSAGRR